MRINSHFALVPHTNNPTGLTQVAGGDSAETKATRGDSAETYLSNLSNLRAMAVEGPQIGTWYELYGN